MKSKLLQKKSYSLDHIGRNAHRMPMSDSYTQDVCSNGDNHDRHRER